MEPLFNYRLLLLLIGLNSFYLSGGQKPSEIYSNIQTALDQRIPESFKAKITSPLVDAQFKQIPKDKITFGTQPYAELIFRKGVGVRLMVRNVDDYFSRLLSIYEEMLGQAGFMLTQGKTRDFATFNKKYELSFSTNNGTETVLKIKERDALPGDYGLYYFDSDWNLTHSDYFEANVMKAQLKMKMEIQGKYFLPTEWNLLAFEQKQFRTLTVTLSDFVFNSVAASEFRGR